MAQWSLTSTSVTPLAGTLLPCRSRSNAGGRARLDPGWSEPARPPERPPRTPRGDQSAPRQPWPLRAARALLPGSRAPRAAPLRPLPWQRRPKLPWSRPPASTYSNRTSTRAQGATASPTRCERREARGRAAGPATGGRAATQLLTKYSPLASYEGPSRLTSSGVPAARPSAKNAPNCSFANSGAPRM